MLFLNKLFFGGVHVDVTSRCPNLISSHEEWTSKISGISGFFGAGTSSFILFACLFLVVL